MVDDMSDQDQGGSPPDAGRAKREPPTIDLEATEVSGETRNASGDGKPEPVSEPASVVAAKPISPWVIAPVSGIVSAALVIGVAWMLGWPTPAVAPVAPPANTAALDDLTARIAGIESKTSKPAVATPDPAAAARADALEKSLASLRSDLAGLRAQSEKLAAAVNDVKSMPRDASAAPLISPPSTSASPRSSAPAARRAPRSRKKVPRSPTPNRPTTRRCAVSWRGRCSMCWSGSAIPIPLP